MGSILTWIPAILKFIWAAISTWLEVRREKRKQKKELFKEGIDAIKKKDPSELISIFDRINRL